MAELNKIVGKFLGKQLMTEAEHYKKYKVTFNIGDKDWNFTAFGPWTKKDGSAKAGIDLKDLEEGKYYNISYTEYQSEAMKYPAKTAQCFFESTQDQAEKQEIPSMQPVNQNNSVSLDPKNTIVADVINTYFMEVDKETRNVTHFIGAMCRTLIGKEVQPLIEEYQRIEETK